MIWWTTALYSLLKLNIIFLSTLCPQLKSKSSFLKHSAKSTLQTRDGVHHPRQTAPFSALQHEYLAHSQ